MSVEEIVLLELDGLKKTICDYTTDNYINSYADQLTKLHYPEDKRKFNLLVERIYNWYEEIMPQIEADEYVHNKAAHIKSYKIICELVKRIN
ncbi:MAG: hypothetical protein QM489_03940 [Candidatus Izemoplasma sp.]